MGTLYSDAQQLQKDIAQLNDGTNGGKWPCTDKMKIFKYDKALEDKPDAEVYLSLDAFSSAVNETVKNFEKIKGIIETPTVVGPDKESSCGGLGSAGTNIVGIMNSMGCGLAQLIHDAAAWGMTEARLLLTSFIGLKINFANVDTTTVSPANTGTAPATTPAATTPAGGTDTSTAVASATSNSPSEFRGVLTLSASDFSKANSLVNKPLDGNIFVWDSTTNGGSGNQQSYPEKIVFYEPDSTNKKIKVKVTCSDSAYLAKISKNSSPEIEVFDNETVITIVVTKANLTAKWSATGSPPNFSVKKIL